MIIESRGSTRSNDYEELTHVKQPPKLTLTQESGQQSRVSSLSADSNKNNYLKLPEIDASPGYYPKIVNNYYEESSLIKNEDLKSKKFTDKSVSALSLNYKSKLNALNDRASRLTMSDYVDLNDNNIVLNDKKGANKNDDSITINEIMKNKKVQLRDLDDKNYIQFLQLQRFEKEKLETNDNMNNNTNNDEFTDSYMMIKNDRAVQRKLLHGLFAPKDTSMNDIIKQLNVKANKTRNESIKIAKEEKLLKTVDHKKDIESSSTFYS
jgi:hypothetical protein